MGKKILIVGAGEAQLNLIHEAKELGYEIIGCDLRYDTEAERISDRFYHVNYMDKESVLKIAKEENVDGVISNSEPAMITVNYVATCLELPGNTVESTEILLSKSKFRDLQRKVGVFSPAHIIADTEDEAVAKAKNLKYPLIIKPVQSSGSRGTTRINDFNEKKIRSAFKECENFSRNNKVAIEEYVPMSGIRVNDADVFVLGDEFFWDGWLWEDRSFDKPMLPMCEIYPMAMPDVIKQEIMTIVEKILRGAGIRFGEFNMESYYSPNGELFVVEINPRQAGNEIPALICQHTGVNLTKLLVSTCVNDMSYYNELKTFKRKNNYVTEQVVFPHKNGIFNSIYIDERIKPYVKKIDYEIQPGSKVVKSVNAADAVAFVNMQFNDYEVQHYFTDQIEKFVYAEVDNLEKNFDY